MKISAEERFWSKVDMSAGPDGCWLWKAGRDKDGYGRFRVGRKKVGSHRFAYALTNGPIPDGMKVCHWCDNPPCCNPSHVFLGTDADNMADRDAKGRQVSGERVWTAKLDPGQVAAIRSAYALEAVTQAELGARYGVSQPMIGYIVRGENWKAGS